MALITVSDVTTYMDITLTNTQEDAVAMIIAGLESELETFLRRPIEQTEFTEQYRIPANPMGVSSRPYFDSSGHDVPTNTEYYHPPLYVPQFTLYLENSPVISVSSVTITPATAGGASVGQVAETDYIVRKYGIDLLNVSSNDIVDVTYTAGLDGPNIKAFTTVLLRAASREVQNMHDDVVGLKDLTTRNVAPLETGFTERELQSVKRYKRVRVS